MKSLLPSIGQCNCLLPQLCERFIATAFLIPLCFSTFPAFQPSLSDRQVPSGRSEVRNSSGHDDGDEVRPPRGSAGLLDGDWPCCPSGRPSVRLNFRHVLHRKESYPRLLDGRELFSRAMREPSRKKNALTVYSARVRIQSCHIMSVKLYSSIMRHLRASY